MFVHFCYILLSCAASFSITMTCVAVSMYWTVQWTDGNWS